MKENTNMGDFYIPNETDILSIRVLNIPKFS
jgi:hypothetical protein